MPRDPMQTHAAHSKSPRQGVPRSPAMLLALASLGAAAWPAAAIINVPADQPTIQAAINAAPAGETIVVAPGVYNQNILVNKPGLTIISSGGGAVTTIQSNVNDVPVVRITVPGVTIGGPQQGFTINQLDAGPAAVPFSGNCAVRITGEAASSPLTPTTITIRNCILTGNATDEGILVNKNLTNARLVVQECTFGKNGGAFGFKTCIYFHFSNPGGGLNTNVSANDCTIDLLNLTGTEFMEYGILFGEDIHKTAVQVLGGSFTGAAGADGGLRFASRVTNTSTVTVDGTTFAEVDDGLSVDVQDHSSLRVLNAAFSNFRDDGSVLYASGDSEVTISNSVFTGNGTTASTGLDCEISDNSSALIDGNTISGVDDYGISFEIDVGSTATLDGNSISMYAGGTGYGIYTYTAYGSRTVVRNNTVSGFEYAGVNESDAYAAGQVTIEGNTLGGAAGGADYGILIDYAEYGSSVDVVNNTATNFVDTGIYVGGSDQGSRVTIRDNRLTGLPATGGDYGIYLDYTVYQSEATVSANTINGFNIAALYINEVYYDGILSADGNVGTAQPAGATYGIYTYQIYGGSSATFTNNQITGFGNQAPSYGFYNDSVYDGGRLTLTGNVFTAHAAFAGYGFYSDDGFTDGATAVVTGNRFSGFTDTGFRADYLGYDGSDATVTDNVFAGALIGAASGLRSPSGVDYGSVATIAGNTFSDFTSDGILIGNLTYGSSLVIHSNLLTATAGLTDQRGINLADPADGGSSSVVTGNRIDGIRDPDGGGALKGYGILVEGAQDGSSQIIADNVVNGLPGGTTYGVYAFQVAHNGSRFELLRNRIAGFTEASVYFAGDTSDGSELLCHDNRLTGAKFGIHYDLADDISAGSIATFERNNVTGFTDTGLLIGGEVWGSVVGIRSNRFLGSGATAGINFTENTNAISSGAEVSVVHNCIGGAATGLGVQNILDTSFVEANFNDFSGVTATGIHNVAGDAAHRIDAENNFFGALAVLSVGQVDTDPVLAAPPDEDADGVNNCSDLCPASPAGQPVDADGCPYDNCPDDPAKFDPGICGCGVSDTDSDADGTADCLDGCPADPAKTAAGICGCSVSDADGDADGTADCLDGCPADPAKTAAGICGCGIADTDSDGDAVADCVDACPAAAGLPELNGCPQPGGDAGQTPPADEGQAAPPQCGAGACGAGGPVMMLPALLGFALMKGGMRRRRWM